MSCAEEYQERLGKSQDEPKWTLENVTEPSPMLIVRRDAPKEEILKEQANYAAQCAVWYFKKSLAKKDSEK